MQTVQRFRHLASHVAPVATWFELTDNAQAVCTKRLEQEENQDFSLSIVKTFSVR